MADKGDELASALCEESTAAMKKTITETRRPLHPARLEGVLVEALPLGAYFYSYAFVLSSCSRLHKLKIDSSRVLSIMYPVRSC